MTQAKIMSKKRYKGKFTPKPISVGEIRFGSAVYQSEPMGTAVCTSPKRDYVDNKPSGKKKRQ